MTVSGELELFFLIQHQKHPIMETDDFFLILKIQFDGM